MLPTSIPRSPPWQTTSTWLRTCTRCAPGYASNRRGVSVDFNPRPRLLRCQPSGRPVYHRTTYSDALKLLVKAGRLRRERRRNDWYYSLGDGQAVMISKITAQPTRSQGSPTTQPRRNQPAASPQPVRSQDSPTTQPRRNDSATDAPICSHNHRPVPMKVAPVWKQKASGIYWHCTDKTSGSYCEQMEPLLNPAAIAAETVPATADPGVPTFVPTGHIASYERRVGPAPWRVPSKFLPDPNAGVNVS